MSFDFAIDDGAEFELVVADFEGANVVADGAVVGVALRAEAAAIMAGVGTDEASGGTACPIATNTCLGIRTDFLQRLQSNNFTVAVELTTMAAEQCGQSKRRSLLVVPVSDAPPFSITLQRKAVIIP